jgi:integrase
MGVQKLGGGRYRVFVDLGRDLEGQRRRHTEVVRGTKKDAERREREILRARETGTYVEPHRMTVAEYMTKWLDSVRHRVAARTFRGYESRTRTHIVPDLGHFKLADLRPLHIEEAESRWLTAGNRRSGRPLDPRSVVHIHRVLHAAMEGAVRWKLLPLNPADGVNPPHVPHREAEFLTVEESERVVTALAGTEYELPILVGLYCGLRPTEYLALRWRDIDLDAGDLRVVQSVDRVRNDYLGEHMGCQVRGYRFGQTKTHRSRRPVSMPELLASLLRDWKEAQAVQRQMAGAAWTELDLAFTDARGYPHSHDRVRRDFYRVLKAAQVRRVVLYALRHTSATLMLSDTKDLKLVASRLGHANEVMVLRTYSHVLPGADKEAARRLGTLVRRRV